MQKYRNNYPPKGIMVNYPDAVVTENRKFPYMIHSGASLPLLWRTQIFPKRYHTTHLLLPTDYWHWWQDVCCRICNNQEEFYWNSGSPGKTPSIWILHAQTCWDLVGVKSSIFQDGIWRQYNCYYVHDSNNIQIYKYIICVILLWHKYTSTC